MAHRLLSEWGFRVFEAESGEEGMEPFLAKPFTRDELLTKVSEALATPTLTRTERPPR
jgi:CheY-like chemotaxis protein